MPMFNFLAANNYIEHEIQTGFTPGLPGTFEHTAQMAHIINKARTKQHSLLITLLDLKNAFGGVHHNLIQTALYYHHIPDPMKSLVKSLYTDFKTSILTNEFRTPFISVGCGVRQDNCLSFFDFNMSNNQHMSELSSLVQDLMNDIHIKPLYSGYVLSKLSWHFTIANISKIWITEHLDSAVNGYVRKWLDIPISGTLSNVFLEHNKCGLNICLPSIKFTHFHL